MKGIFFVSYRFLPERCFAIFAHSDFKIMITTIRRYYEDETNKSAMKDCYFLFSSSFSFR